MIDMTQRGETEEPVFDMFDDGCGGFKAFYDSMVEKGYMRYNEKDGIYKVVDIRGINKCLFGGEITTEEETRDELTEFILDRLTTDGYVTDVYLMAAWLNIAGIRMHERLEQLKEEGRISCSPDGVRWQLKFTGYPVSEEDDFGDAGHPEQEDLDHV